MTKCKLIIGDVHFPFVYQRTLNSIYQAIKRYQPTHVIQVGDLYDLYSFGRFPRLHTFIRPDVEIMQARKMAEKFWSKIRSLSPGVICYQILGNHDERISKKILASNNPEIHFLVADKLRELYRFEGVHTQPSERDELILDGVMYMHGFYSRIGQHASANNMPTVHGHTHRAGICFIRNGNKTLWEFDVGYVADPSALPLSYTRQRVISKTTQGYGLIFGERDYQFPAFVPLANPRV